MAGTAERGQITGAGWLSRDVADIDGASRRTDPAGAA
jgi:hypothetical protein